MSDRFKHLVEAGAIEAGPNAVPEELRHKIEALVAGLHTIVSHTFASGVEHFGLPKDTEVDAVFMIKLPIDPETAKDEEAVKGLGKNPLGFAPMPGRGSNSDN